MHAERVKEVASAAKSKANRPQTPGKRLHTEDEELPVEDTTAEEDAGVALEKALDDAVGEADVQVKVEPVAEAEAQQGTAEAEPPKETAGKEEGGCVVA